ncbi:class I SAM-dependent methyltransferase [Rhizobium sp. PAMB 3182]
MSKATHDRGAAAGSAPVGRLSLWQKIMCRMVDRIQVGSITLQFPGGRSHTVAGAEPGPDATLYLKNPRPIIRLMTSGDLGFAKSYIDGDWDSPDISALLNFALLNEKALRSVIAASAIWGKVALLRHRLRRNSKRGSRRNIAYHYDLGNDFYRLWLDETMTYSSALFEEPHLTLSEAQTAKYARIVRELEIGPDDHVLEIGCGWGGFAEYAIRQTGCRVTGLTLSKEQAAFASDRLERAGLGDKSDIRIEDYRDCGGEFDKIVSIEMFEAVGEENWPVYFSAVRDRLKPGGKAMIQTITIDDERFDDYRRNADYIQTYIFPGGMLPSFATFRNAAGNAGLAVKDWLGFGKHYARTLLTWEQDFIAQWERIRPMGFDERFKRMWRYYLHYCAAGFQAGSINVLQFKLEKA